MRQYGREVGIEFYSDWMRRLASNHTEQELETMLDGNASATRKAAKTHLNAIDKTGSMSGNSQHRAQSRNVLAASGDYGIALRGALEIHELFPEFAKK